MRFRALAVLLLTMGSGACAAVAAEPTFQEKQCMTAGWQRLLIDAAGQQRSVLSKAPAGGWRRGALVVLHGGGGQHANFCVANAPVIAAQVRFTDLALAQGFAVFLPDSSDRVTDNESRPCGKVWDDEVRARANLDLPFLERLLSVTIPGERPAGGHAAIFLAGHSSGGFMTVRAATNLSDRITAFALVASGDPYGWHRDCTPRRTDRANVFGAGFDNDTRRQIIEPGACGAPPYANEKPWDGPAQGAKPAWRAFHHMEDGINDASCVARVSSQLRARGFPETAAFRLSGGTRSAGLHLWLDAYNQPLLDFFTAQLR